MSNPIIVYNNLADTGTLTPTSTDTNIDYDPLNVKDWRPYTLWKASSSADQNFDIDFGSATTADTLVIMGHNLFTAGSSIRVIASSSSSFTSPVEVLATTVVTSNKIIYKELTTITSKRYWRLEITGNSVAPYMGIYNLSNRLVFTQPLSNKLDWDPNGYLIKSRSQVSNTGNILGNVVDRKEIIIRPFFKYLSASFVEGAFATFWDTHASIQKPFFWSWEPTNHPNDIHLVIIPNDMDKQFPYRDITTYRDVTLDFRGVIEV